MPQTIQIGHFAVDGYLIVYFLALVAGYFTIKIRLRIDGIADRPYLDIIFTGILIVVFVWKFGSLWYNSSLIWTKPWLILMLRGTWEHIVFGLALALIYAGYRLWKLRLSLLQFADVLPYGYAAATICKGALIWEYGAPTAMPWGISLTDPSLHYHPLHVYQLLLAAAWLTLFWRRKIGQGKVMQDALIYYGLGLWVISYFSYAGPDSTMLNGVRIVYLGMIVCGLIIPYIIRKIEYK